MTKNKPIPRCNVIVPEICSHFGISRRELFSRMMAYRVAMPRQIAYYLIYKLLNQKEVPIAEAFDRCPSAINRGRQRVWNMCQVNPEFAQTLATLERRCRALVESERVLSGEKRE